MSITDTRILCMASNQGQTVLFCMRNTIMCNLFVSMMECVVAWGLWGTAFL
jgi:hypothetical protein